MHIAHYVTASRAPHVGDLALAEISAVGRSARVELANGRMSTVFQGDLVTVVFGNRYATAQYEAYARARGNQCALLTAAGVCGEVTSKHASIGDPTMLAITGYLCDVDGRVLSLADFALERAPLEPLQPRAIAVCGATMDSGKTYTAASIIRGLAKAGLRVGAAKLTGTASGRDTWHYLDAGAFQVYDFSDCGFPSTYGCTTADLLRIHATLTSRLASAGAEVLVFEVADGVLQQETVALLESPAFLEAIDAFVYAAADPLAVVGGLASLRAWSIVPVGVSGKISMSPLAIREAELATGLTCYTAAQLACGALNDVILKRTRRTPAVIEAAHPSGQPSQMVALPVSFA